MMPAAPPQLLPKSPPAGQAGERLSPRALERLWDDYAEHHRSKGNKWCHLAGIPMIIAGLLGLLSIPVFHVRGLPVEGALLLVILAGAIYVWLDRKLGAAMAGAGLVLYLGARLLPWPACLGLFLAGWVFQFIGHGVYEKRSPAFLANLAHLLVGPMWVLNHLLKIRP